MTEDIVKKMQEYLATATEEQLAKDYEELVNNHNGPTVDEYFNPNSDRPMAYTFKPILVRITDGQKCCTCPFNGFDCKECETLFERTFKGKCAKFAVRFAAQEQP